MSTDEEIQSALLAIHSRLGTIEGKVTLVARADRERIVEVLKEVIQRKPIVGQIYLLVDGTKTQTEIHEALSTLGITTSPMTVSRRMDEMLTEYGIADLVRGGKVKVIRRNREMEDVLNLSKRVREWLEEMGQPLPPAPGQRRRRRKASSA